MRERPEVEELEAECDRLQKMLDVCSAVHVHNVALKSERDRLRKLVDTVCELLAQNGCDCECDHHPEEHDDDCERCLACRIGDVVDRGRT